MSDLSIFDVFCNAESYTNPSLDLYDQKQLCHLSAKMLSEII